MPFRFDEYVALVKAGYTREEIEKMESSEPVQERTPEPAPAEHNEPETAAEATPAAEPVAPAEEADELAAVKDEIAALRKAIQALNVKTAYRTDDREAVTPESILESILVPQNAKK